MQSKPRLLALPLLLALLLALPTATRATGVAASEAEEDGCILGCDEAHTTVVYDRKAVAVTVADLNGDGLKDIVVAESNKVAVLARTDLNSSWETVFQVQLGSSASPSVSAVAVADLNGGERRFVTFDLGCGVVLMIVGGGCVFRADGWLDIAAGVHNDLAVLFNNGNGTSYDVQ